MNGMTRGATQEPGGWKPPAVMESVYNKSRCEEVVPEMRAAVPKAFAIVEVTSSVGDLDREARAYGDDVLGSEKGPPSESGFIVFALRGGTWRQW